VSDAIVQSVWHPGYWQQTNNYIPGVGAQIFWPKCSLAAANWERGVYLGTLSTGHGATTERIARITRPLEYAPIHTPNLGDAVELALAAVGLALYSSSVGVETQNVNYWCGPLGFAWGPGSIGNLSEAGGFTWPDK